MIPIDEWNAEYLSAENAEKMLSRAEYGEFERIPVKEREEELRQLLCYPIAHFSPVNELYFRTKWAALFQTQHQDKPLVLLEAASGDADMIPQTLARSQPGSTYISANMNRLLNESLAEKLKPLDLEFQLIDDDAARIADYIGKGTVDVIAFQHGVNDILQAILCSEYGVDTIYADWMELLPKMIKLLQEELGAGTFVEKVKKPFLDLIQNLSATLKQDGMIAIHHYMFQLDLDWGYPPELFENLIPMIREWFQEETSLEEVFFEGCHPQWWLFLK